MTASRNAQRELAAAHRGEGEVLIRLAAAFGTPDQPVLVGTAMPKVSKRRTGRRFYTPARTNHPTTQR